MSFWNEIVRPAMTRAELDKIEQRYKAAHTAGDIGQLAILAVEVFPALIRVARRSYDKINDS